MTSIREVLQALSVELTPQAWDYTNSDGATLTVVPDGVRRAHGEGVVALRITQNHHTAATAYIATAEQPTVREVLTKGTSACYREPLADLLVMPAADGSIELTIEPWEARSARMTLPSSQLLPLLAALNRATDAARGWEH